LIGQYSITLAYSHAPAAEVSVFNYSSIIIATILGFLLWSEVPDILSGIGGLFIVIAGIFSWWYNQKKR